MKAYIVLRQRQNRATICLDSATIWSLYIVQHAFNIMLSCRLMNMTTHEYTNYILDLLVNLILINIVLTVSWIFSKPFMFKLQKWPSVSIIQLAVTCIVICRGLGSSWTPYLFTFKKR